MNARCLTIALFGTCLASAAFAHAFLEQANPSAGGHVRGSPSIVAVTFHAPVEPRFSLIEIRDFKGNRMGRARRIGATHANPIADPASAYAAARRQDRWNQTA